MLINGCGDWWECDVPDKLFEGKNCIGVAHELPINRNIPPREAVGTGAIDCVGKVQANWCVVMTFVEHIKGSPSIRAICVIATERYCDVVIPVCELEGLGIFKGTINLKVAGTCMAALERKV